MLTCYSLKKDHATFYRPETIVASLLLLMVLSLKVNFNLTSKRQFVVLHFRIPPLKLINTMYIVTLFAYWIMLNYFDFCSDFMLFIENPPELYHHLVPIS